MKRLLLFASILGMLTSTGCAVEGPYVSHRQYVQSYGSQPLYWDYNQRRYTTGYENYPYHVHHGQPYQHDISGGHYVGRITRYRDVSNNKPVYLSPSAQGLKNSPARQK